MARWKSPLASGESMSVKTLKLGHAQLDFYTDHWAIVAFPIARVTMVCERSVAASSPLR